MENNNISLKHVTPHPLKVFLNKRKIHQTDIAISCDVSPGGISHILSIYRRPSPELDNKLKKLASFLRKAGASRS